MKTRIALVVGLALALRWLQLDRAASWEGGAILPWPGRHEDEPVCVGCGVRYTAAGRLGYWHTNLGCPVHGWKATGALDPVANAKAAMRRWA